MFDFKALGTPETFQRLCAELLEAEGAQHVRGHGIGADQGCDFLAEITESSLFGARKRIYLVQCKCWTERRSISQSEISDALMSLSLHGADGLLFIATTGFSGTAVTKLNAFVRERSDPRAAVYWDADDLSKRLWKHPKVAARYFGPKGPTDERESATKTPARNHKLLDYAVPKRYATVALQSLPLGDDEMALGGKIRAALERLRSGSASVVLFCGWTGSGKTTLACGLLNELAFPSSDVRFYSSLEYSRELFDYCYRHDPAYLPLLADLKEAECLIIDDFGEYLRDETESQRFALECLCEIIETRRRLRRPTLLPVYYDWAGIGLTTRRYLDVLRVQELSIELGHVSRRPSGIHAECHSGGTYLGQGWLCEKFEKLGRAFERALDICTTPDDVYLGRQQAIFELHGVRPVTKQDELITLLSSKLAMAKSYREFIESLDFESLFFAPDGTVELLRPQHLDKPPLAGGSDAGDDGEDDAPGEGDCEGEDGDVPA